MELESFRIMSNLMTKQIIVLIASISKTFSMMLPILSAIVSYSIIINYFSAYFINFFNSFLPNFFKFFKSFGSVYFFSLLYLSLILCFIAKACSLYCSFFAFTTALSALTFLETRCLNLSFKPLNASRALYP